MPTIELPQLYPKQLACVNDPSRFKSINGGRRSAKTIMGLVKGCENALQGRKQAFYYPSPKFIRTPWANITNYLRNITTYTNQTEKYIKLTTGGQINFWSVADPETGRGEDNDDAFMDECEFMQDLQYSYENVVAPSLVKTGGTLWVMSSPSGSGYFKDLCESTDPDWKNFHFTTYDNPYIKRSEIERWRRMLPDNVFRQEFLAEFVSFGNAFAYEFNDDKHVGDADFNNKERLYFSFDFNIEPITAIVAQSDGETIKIIDEFRIMNGTIYLICEAIKQKYGDYLFDCEITGDPAGHARQLTGKNPVAYYYLIKEQLEVNNYQMKAPRAQFGHKNSRLLLNSVFYSKPITISHNCRHLIADLKYVQAGEDGSIKKEGSAAKHFTHLLDCLINYLYTYHHKHIIK